MPLNRVTEQRPADMPENIIISDTGDTKRLNKAAEKRHLWNSHTVLIANPLFCASVQKNKSVSFTLRFKIAKLPKAEQGYISKPGAKYLSKLIRDCKPFGNVVKTFHDVAVFPDNVVLL